MFLKSRLVIVFAQSIEGMCQVENEDVVGAALIGNAPTILLSTKVWLIIEVSQ